MPAVGQRSTETYQDLGAIILAIKRMTVPPIKSTIRKINDLIAPSNISIHGNKQPLIDRLIAHFTNLKQNNMANQYAESRRILESEFGSLVSQNRSFGYTAPAASTPSANLSRMNNNNNSYAALLAQQQQQQIHEARQRAFASNSLQSHHIQHGSHLLSSASVSASNAFMPSVRPHFKASPFLEVKDWVGPAVICPEAPSKEQRSSTTLKMQLNASNLELLKRPTAIHQLRLFCTTKTYFDAATNANHPAPVEFPLSCEVKVNHIPLSVNLRGKKMAAKVLAPHLNKDHALYFGGQDNKVELVYTATSQKYVLSVAICEIRKADTLARRIKREKIRSKDDVLKAMKVAAQDDDIEMGDVSMGLKCPLGAMRMTAPIRSGVCVHMQCFDALSFFSMNEQTPSWQCPICDKTINPDTLFLDGYVLDILEKVPEDEETVLVDAQGKWHTPNKKFSSEGDEQPRTPPKESIKASPSSRDIAVNGSNSSIPPVSTPPPSEKRVESQRNTKNVEVFEIDDDDDDDDTPLLKEKAWQLEQAQKEEQATEAIKQQKRVQAAADRLRESIRLEKERAQEKGSPAPTLQHLQPPSMMENATDKRASSSREPSQSRVSNIGQILNSRPSGIALKESPALPSPGLPTMTEPISKPVAQVIDLTLSDSDDDVPLAASRRRQNSGLHGHASVNASSSSHVFRPPSVPFAAQSSLPRRPSATSMQEGGHRGSPNLSAPNGAVRPSPVNRPSPFSHSSKGAPSNGSNNQASSHSQQSSAQGNSMAPPRRRVTTPDEEDSEDEDEEDSQPIRRHRKRQRYGGRPYPRSEEEEEESSHSDRSGGGSSSERLFEEERAGLAIRP